MKTRLERLVQSIVDLGFASQAEIDALADDWARAMFEEESTFDDDHETSGFLNYLQTRGVLSPTQLRGLLAILSSSGGAPAPSPEDPLLGRRFGEFISEEKLGEGAMGRVYRARRADAADAERYVIKVFTSMENADDHERFRREAELMARIDHPNVVRSFGSGVESGHHYVVLEYVPGETLQQLMERRRRLPWEGAVRAAGQIAQALRAAHKLGIVHRDVKPHNVLVRSDGTLKLCDFGLAKASEVVQVRSRAGMILGSPAYIAPEQWGDHDVDHRADLFALGVVTYFLVTGAYPFRGRTPADFATRIQSGEFPPLETLAPGAPPALSWVVTQLLERERRFRTPSAAALIDDLASVIQGKLPDVPRLEGPGGAFVALVGRDMFRIGRDPKSELWLNIPEVQESHARIERTNQGGFMLRTIHDQAWVVVNGQRAQGEIKLKSDDVVTLAPDLDWTYRAGNLEVRPPNKKHSGVFKTLPGPEREERLDLPAVLVDALADGGHALALLACIEDLDTRALRIQAARSEATATAAGVAPDLVRRMRLRARQIGIRRREWLSNCLFHTTYENLGSEVVDWLAWWWDARGRYLLQVRPTHPEHRAYVDVEEREGPRRVGLDAELSEWGLGRSLQSEVSIRDVSVSRSHATILRLARGYAFRDLGSRQGVRVEGDRRSLGTLLPGDALHLGRVQVRFNLHEQDPPRPGLSWVDRLSFTALVEEGAPQVTATLTRLLDAEQLAASYGPLVEEHAAGVTNDLIGPFFQSQRVLALEALPRATGVNLGPDPRAWSAWVAENASRLPAQLAPRGWLL